MEHLKFLAPKANAGLQSLDRFCILMVIEEHLTQSTVGIGPLAIQVNRIAIHIDGAPHIAPTGQFLRQPVLRRGVGPAEFRHAAELRPQLPELRFKTRLGRHGRSLSRPDRYGLKDEHGCGNDDSQDRRHENLPTAGGTGTML